MGIRPEILNIKRRAGVAGQVAYEVTLQYPGEEPEVTTFVGSVYGGPVVMLWGDKQVFVRDPGRHGEFGREWVRRFYADRS